MDKYNIQMSLWRGEVHQWQIEAASGAAALEVAAVTHLGFASYGEAIRYTNLVAGLASQFTMDRPNWEGFLRAYSIRNGPVPRHVTVRNDGNVPTTFRVALTAKSYNRQGQLQGTTSVTEEWFLGMGVINVKGAPIYFPTMILVPFGSVVVSAELWAISPYRSVAVDSREITLDTNDF